MQNSILPVFGLYVREKTFGKEERKKPVGRQASGLRLRNKHNDNSDVRHLCRQMLVKSTGDKLIFRLLGIETKEFA